MPKSMWNGTISFGLVNVPVKMYTSVSPKAVKFHQINSETGNRVKQKRVDEHTGAEVAFDKIVKGYEIAPDRHVIVTDEELQEISVKNTKQIVLDRFVHAGEIPTMAIEKTYFLGPDAAGGKAYALLADALLATEMVGIGSVVIRTNQRLAAITALPDGTLTCCLLVHADEINRHDDLGVEGSGEVTDAEVTMAVNLVNALAEPFDYESYKDTYRERVMALVEAKSAGVELEREPEPEKPQAADMLAALEASLATVRGSKVKSKAKSAAS